MGVTLNNSFFVHVPKTGGTWLRHVLRELGLIREEKGGWKSAHVSFGESGTSLPAFGFVRHPLAWAKSRWVMATALDTRSWFFGVNREFEDHVQPTFSDTIARIVAKRPGLVSETFETLLSGVEHIGRQENLREDASRILQKLEGVTIPKDDFATPFNTSRQFRVNADTLPATLEREFVLSENKAISRWYGG